MAVLVKPVPPCWPSQWRAWRCEHEECAMPWMTCRNFDKAVEAAAAHQRQHHPRARRTP